MYTITVLVIGFAFCPVLHGQAYKLTALPLNADGIAIQKGGGYEETVGTGGVVKPSCSEMSLKTLRLGDRELPLKSAAVTSSCMIETKDYGELLLKVNTATFSANILVTPKQEEALKKLVAPVPAPAAKSDKSAPKVDDLIDAASAGDADAVQALLARGLGVNAKNDDGSTALIAASANGHRELVQALLAKGANVNAKTTAGMNSLMWASRQGDSEVVRALLTKGADVNAKTTAGITALMVASRQGNREIVQSLLAKGADVNAKLNDGTTALKMATSAELKALLVQAGAQQ